VTGAAPPARDVAVGAAALTILRRLGLSRLLRLVVVGAIPPLWLEIALLHYRGSFQSRPMWAPVLLLPLELATGAAAAVSDRAGAAGAFRRLSWGTTALGALGTLMHLRGVRRQMGGLREWRYNLMTGPPVLAPPQVALLGLVGVLATSERPTAAIVHDLRWIGVLGQLLLAAEVSYAHDQNYYANPVQFAPLVLAPALTLAQLAALAPFRTLRRSGRRLELPLSGAAALAGLIGFAFHVKNIRSRAGGLSWQNLFYGPPVVAPLQLSGQGAFGLLASLFDDRE
jgi:hypothetical protein